MEHISKYDGRSYQIGVVNDVNTSETYDLITIMYFPTEKEIDNGKSFEVIDLYFGDYDFDTTEYYIESYYLKDQV